MVFLHAGFATASEACCGNGGQYAGIIPCGPTSSMCNDREKHVFWDPYHPSEAANVIIARQLLNGSTKYISPVNLKQLRNLWLIICDLLLIDHKRVPILFSSSMFVQALSSNEIENDSITSDVSYFCWGWIIRFSPNILLAQSLHLPSLIILPLTPRCIFDSFYSF